MFATGPPTVQRVKPVESVPTASVDEVILCLSTVGNGERCLCVTNKFITVWGSYCCTTRLARIDLPKEYANSTNLQVCWKPNGTNFLLCCPNQGMLDVFELRGTSIASVQLALPEWSTINEDMNMGEDLVEILHQYQFDGATVGHVTTIACNDSNIVIGTKDGKVLRLYWEQRSDAVISEIRLYDCHETFSDVAESDRSHSLIQAELGVDNFVGFATNTGIAGVLKLHKSKANTLDTDLSKLSIPVCALIPSSKATGVAMLESRPLVAVQRMDSRVDIFSYEPDQLDDTISFRCSLSLQMWDISPRLSGRVTSMAWTSHPDDFICVCYEKLGFVLWTEQGCRVASYTTSNEQHRLQDQETSSPTNTHHVSYGPVVWVNGGYQLVVAENHSKTVNDSCCLLKYDFVKSCTSLSLRASEPSQLCLTGPDYLLMLKIKQWTEDTLAWERIQIPIAYAASNCPVTQCAISADMNQVAVAGATGLALFNFKTRKWRLFGDINQERSITCTGLFWWGDAAICVVNKVSAANREKRTAEKYELLCYPANHLDSYSQLFSMPLQSKPLAVDCQASGLLVIQFAKETALYKASEDIADSTSRISLNGVSQSSQVASITNHDAKHHKNLDEEGEVVAEQFTLKFTLVKRIPLVANRSVPTKIFILPFGQTRLSGASISYPRLALLDNLGSLFVINTEDHSTTKIISHVRDCWSHYWWPSQTTTKGSPWPKSVSHVMWLYCQQGTYLWIPSLDSDGQGVNDQQTVTLPFDSEVYPLGVHPVFNTIFGIVQRPVKVTALRLTCFEICTKAQPCLHGLLQWHLITNRDEQIGPILTAAMDVIPYLPQALEYWLFSTVELEFEYGAKNPTKQGIVVRAMKLLRNFNVELSRQVVVQCARKIEPSRLTLIFPQDDMRVKLFDECVDHAPLRLAAACIPLLPGDQQLVYDKMVQLYKAAVTSGQQELANEIKASVDRMEPSGFLARVLRRLPQVV